MRQGPIESYRRTQMKQESGSFSSSQQAINLLILPIDDGLPDN